MPKRLRKTLRAISAESQPSNQLLSLAWPLWAVVARLPVPSRFASALNPLCGMSRPAPVIGSPVGQHDYAWASAAGFSPTVTGQEFGLVLCP